MMDTNNLFEFRSFRKAQQIVGGVTLLLALTLAGPPRLWGDCQQGIGGLSLNQGSIIALAPGPQGTAQGSVTLNCPATFNYYILYIEFYIHGVYVGSQELGGLGATVFSFGVSSEQDVSAPTTMTLMATLWPLDIWSGGVSEPIRLPAGARIVW
jgi:hypothetical protein